MSRYRPFDGRCDELDDGDEVAAGADASEADPEAGPDLSAAALASPPARSGGRWRLAAVVVLVLGVAISLLGGALWRSSVQREDAHSFDSSAVGAAETAEALLRGDANFVATLRGLLTMEPEMSPTRFAAWTAQLRSSAASAGGVGSTVVASVRAARLRAFLARRDADPAFRVLIGGALLPVSAARKHPLCLLAAGAERRGGLGARFGALVQENWCSESSALGRAPAGASTMAQTLAESAASGRLIVYPVNVEGLRTTFFQLAYYRRGAPLRTSAQRRAALLGWVQTSVDMQATIRDATGASGHLAIEIYHTNPDGSNELVGRTAGASAGRLRHEIRFDVGGEWSVRVAGAPVASTPSATLQGSLIALGGLLVTILLAALVCVLGRSRDKALVMVEEKTGELRHQALHDALTGLPNRVLALDRAEQMLARSRRRSVPVAALYVDVDGFKHVNDSFGHAAGDELLRIVASRLASVVREGDTAARLGGDEFVVLVEGSTLDAGPELVAERVLEVLRQPYDVNWAGRELALTASVGIASGPRSSADELLADADVALYEAKASGRNRWTVFESGMETAARDRLTIALDLAEALERKQFLLLYQPTFDLRSEEVVGVEALIRWRHPERGVVSPAEFIPIAEERGLIVPIGRWVLREACRQARAWHEQGYPIGIAVNVSARQLDEDSLLSDVSAALRDSGLDAHSLTLEVTETALMRDPAATAERLRELKRLGVRIAIDDFGTGYSSLAYLRRFPADALKIDRSFVADVAASDQSSALVHTLVELGRTLHIETLAEGIEEQSQLDALRRERCDHGQGFLFSCPLDQPAAEAFLRESVVRGRWQTPAASRV